MQIELVLQAAKAAEKKLHRSLQMEVGITVPQFEALRQLKSGVQTMGAMADEMHCSRGNMTGVTDRLDRDGLVIRERSKDDRRVVTISLTEKGVATLAKAEAVAAYVLSSDVPAHVAAYLTNLITQLQETA
jgi:DNA-binding MarR family transcriptional regulator